MVTWGPSTTNIFGTSTPASSTTVGGTTTTAIFGGTPAAGAAPSTPPLTPQAPAGNPPPLSTGFSFGGGAAAPSGGSSVGGGLFGAPAPAPTGGLFGSTSTSAPAPSGGLFGSTPAPATSGGLFGSTPAPAPSGGFFGNNPAPSGGFFGASAPAPSGGLFGAPTPAPSGGLFGASAPAPSAFSSQPSFQSAQNPHQAAYHAHQSASAHQEAARIEEAVANLHSKYSTTAMGTPSVPSSLCAFTAIMYDALTGEQRSAIAALSTTNIQSNNYLNNRMASMSLSATVIPKPPHISQKVWNEAQARNPNPGELTPVALVGASSLHSRLIAQQEKATALADHVSTLKDSLGYLQKACNHSREGIRRASLEQESLQRRLLETMRKVEIIRCMGQPVQSAEREAMERMERLLREVNSLTRGVVEVEERGREQGRAWKKKAVSGLTADLHWLLEKEDKSVLIDVLNEQRSGLEGLGHILKRDERDLGILKEELEKSGNPGSGSGAGCNLANGFLPNVGDGGVAIFTGH
ncbi:hypothetical protein ACHAW6_004464 [Cyclotella cf. meneghiniana]